MAVKKIPQGFHTVTPILTVRGAEELANFVRKAFGATDLEITRDANGKAMHIDLRIGDSHVMIGEAMDGMPQTAGSLYLYVDDADAVYKRALQAGATSEMQIDDQPWGDRVGGIRDRFGNHWMVATHLEDVSNEEVQRRMAAMSPHGAGAPA